MTGSRAASRAPGCGVSRMRSRPHRRTRPRPVGAARMRRAGWREGREPTRSPWKSAACRRAPGRAFEEPELVRLVVSPVMVRAMMMMPVMRGCREARIRQEYQRHRNTDELTHDSTLAFDVGRGGTIPGGAAGALSIASREALRERSRCFGGAHPIRSFNRLFLATTCALTKRGNAFLISCQYHIGAASGPDATSGMTRCAIEHCLRAPRLGRPCDSPCKAAAGKESRSRRGTGKGNSEGRCCESHGTPDSGGGAAPRGPRARGTGSARAARPRSTRQRSRLPRAGSGAHRGRAPA
jgi:hypothetical protein